MSEWASEWISFDMSRAGLVELSAALEPAFAKLTPELQNFANEIRSMTQKTVVEESWLDA